MIRASLCYRLIILHVNDGNFSENIQAEEPKTLEQDTTTLENNRASQEDAINEAATNTADATDMIEEVRQLDATPQQESARKEKKRLRKLRLIQRILRI